MKWDKVLYKINNNKKQQKSIDKINFNVYNKDNKTKELNH